MATSAAAAAGTSGAIHKYDDMIYYNYGDSSSKHNKNKSQSKSPAKGNQACVKENKH
jgi:hypothetical protein